MKRFLGTVALLSVLLVVGCRSIYSPCDVVLYSVNGSVIQQWQGVKYVRVYNGIARFMDDGNYVRISGTFIVNMK